MKTVLVTGGAGYIGCHVVRQLSEAGYRVVVYDNLSGGHRELVLGGELIVGDLADEKALDAVFTKYKFESVLHFAGSIVVSESVQNPNKYFQNNTENTRILLEACQRHGARHFIFSSTAAVYGIPDRSPISEDAPIKPINPYGESKARAEKLIVEMSERSEMRHVILRYFNAAGADPMGRMGECHDPETHLIPLALQVASGRRPHLDLYGTDYPTPDGTCIRDYIHVEDLASAHLAALKHLETDGKSEILNCGYGRGHSVKVVIEVIEKVVDHPLKVHQAARRSGDAVELIADSRRLKQVLSWQSRYDSLEIIVSHAWRWEKK